MRFRLLKPRELARTLRLTARNRPDEVEEYLEGHAEEWSALAEAAPGEAADILEAISEEAAGELLTDLDADDAAELLEELRDELAAEILSEMPTGEAADLLTEMEPEDAADILAAVEDEQRVEELLDQMETVSAAEVRQLLAYAPDSAGGLMTTDVAAVPVGLTAGEAIERIRQLQEELEHLSYVYVVDDGGRLEGVISFRDLVFARPGRGLDEVMIADPISVHTSTDREVVAELVQRYNLVGVPVVDDLRILQGMVAAEEIIEAIQQEASEDFAASVGAGAEETVYTEITRSVRMRLPWLMLNLVLALAVAFAIEQQTHVISREPVLAALMPVIALLGGNGGSQSLAVVIRGMATDSVPRSRVFEILGRQASVGLINGLALAVFSGLVSFALLSGGIFAAEAPPLHVAAIVAFAALANLTIAATVGTGIPMVMRRLGFDPALASSIFLTLITDVVGFGGFLVVASVFL